MLSHLDIGLSLADFDLLAQGNCIGRSAHANLHIVALDSEVFAVPICQRTRFQWNRHGTGLAGVDRHSEEALQLLLRAGDG